MGASLAASILFFALFRSNYPDECKSIEELWSPQDYEAPNVPLQLFKPAKTESVETVIAKKLISAIPGVLEANPVLADRNGWCRGDKENVHRLLVATHDDGGIDFKIYRSAILRSLDKVSSSIDRSQTGSANNWGLVSFDDGHLCVVRIEKFVSVQVTRSGLPCFNSTLCQKYGIPYPEPIPGGMKPLDLVVTTMWQAESLGEKEGAIGCRVDCDLNSPPDLIRVRNYHHKTMLKDKYVARDAPGSRCFGIQIVPLADIMCSICPASDPTDSSNMLFMTASRNSDK